MEIRIDRWIRWPETRRAFCRNLICGLITLFILYLISCTGIGQKMLNDTYDFFVSMDFRLSSGSEKSRDAISDSIRIIAFDKESCEESPGQGFWTPRESLGKTIIRAIELGAKVVIVDFALDSPVPLYYKDGAFVEENQRYLSLLRKAVTLAEQKGAVILLPWKERKKEPKGYTAQYYELIDTNRHIIRQGSPGIFHNDSDFNVRHLRFYEKDGDRVMVSLPILAAMYQWHGIEKGHKILEATETRLKNASGIVISIPSDGNTPDIRLYPQSSTRECLPARFKFRIAPREVYAEYDCVYDPLVKIMRNASDFLKSDLSEKMYKGKTVLIGPTYSEIGDTHITPVGKMPGVFVLANGVNLFLKGEQIREHPLLKYGMIVLILVLSAFSFARFPMEAAALGMTGLLVFMNISVGIWIFSISGIFLDFWLIIAGIAILENIVGLAERAEKWYRPDDQSSG